MHDITNGSKHYYLIKHKPEVTNTTLHKGAFNNGFNRAYDIDSLDGNMLDGKKFYFEDELKAVVDFWRDYFINALKESL